MSIIFSVGKKSVHKGIMGGGRTYNSDPLYRSWQYEKSAKQYFVYYKYKNKWYLIRNNIWTTQPHAIKEFIHEKYKKDGEYIWNTGKNSRTNYYWNYKEQGTYDSDLYGTVKLDTLKGVDTKKLPTEVLEYWEFTNPNL
jgi:hypothetical protein